MRRPVREAHHLRWCWETLRPLRKQLDLELRGRVPRAALSVRGRSPCPGRAQAAPPPAAEARPRRRRPWGHRPARIPALTGPTQLSTSRVCLAMVASEPASPTSQSSTPTSSPGAAFPAHRRPPSPTPLRPERAPSSPAQRRGSPRFAPQPFPAHPTRRASPGSGAAPPAPAAARTQPLGRPLQHRPQLLAAPPGHGPAQAAAAQLPDRKSVV